MDGIIAAETQKMSESVAKTTGQFVDQKKEQDVKLFLKSQKNANFVNDMQQTVSDIQQKNYVNQIN
jgi:hypothetical protein